MALTIVAACRDTAPTDAVQVLGSKPKSICIIGVTCQCSDPTNPACTPPPADTSLKLLCSDRLGHSDTEGGATIVRGDSVSCRASSATADPLVVATWSFLSSDTSFLHNRTDEGAVYVPDSSHWAGQMVKSGTVTVRGTIGAQSVTKSALVTVTNRDWSKDTVAYTIKPVGTEYGDPPVSIEQLGSNVHGAVYRIDLFAQVGNGPNHGLAFYSALPWRFTFDVSYNEKAMVRGSEFYKMQATRFVVVNGTPFCANTHVVDDIPLVKAHEGFKMTDINSHTEVYNRFFLNYVRDSAERKVDLAIQLNVDSLQFKADSLADAASEQITHNPSTNPYHTDCNFNFDSNRRLP
jgi:hypothetical protein